MSQSSTAVREPLLRIAKREGTTMPQKIAVRAIAILLALVVDALFIYFVTGLNPLAVYGVMWGGTFANMTRFSWMLRDLSILLCVGIALAPAFKMRFWNCGGEGQILIGGLIAALVMVYQGNNLPTPVLFAAMTIGSMAAGALWGFVPAWFKSRWGTNETLFTLMMNYVATSIVACMTNIMRGQASSLGTLNKATKAGWFPIIMGQRYTINIIVVIVLTFAMYAYLKFSKQGYEISVVGESENTARYAGINVRRVTVRTMLISGAVCGLCGFLIVAGKDQTIATTSAGGRGFTAIIVAWLARLNPFVIVVVTALFSFVLPQVADSIRLFVSSLSGYMANLQALADEVFALFDREGVDFSSLNEYLRRVLEGVLNTATNAASHVLVITSGVISMGVTLVLAIVFSVYMLSGREKLLSQCRRVMRAYLPGSWADRVQSVVQLSADTFTNFVSGQLTEACILGVLCALGMLFIQSDYAALVGVIVGTTALIPVMGAYIGAVLPAFLLLMVDPWRALAFLVFLGILQQIEGNVIYPRVVGTSIGLPGIWVLAAVTVGGGLFGLLGVLLSVPAASVLYTLLKRDVHRRLEEKMPVPEQAEEGTE